MLKVTWIDRGQKPKEQPDPNYPDGIAIDMSDGRKGCSTNLPYPAKRIGYYLVECDTCGKNIMITTAGRADDPRHIKIACKLQ